MNDDLKEYYAKRTKMFNQTERIIELSEVSFNSLINVLKQKMGEEVSEVLRLLYQEKDVY
jgi:phenylalanyl-tRNA synthetase alpha subunit